MSDAQVFGPKFTSFARFVLFLFAAFAILTLAGAVWFSYAEYKTPTPQYANLASAMAGLTGAAASLATLVFVIKEQQKLFESQFKLQASSAQLSVAVSRIDTCKAVLETLRQGANVPFRDQEFGSRKEDFDALRSQFREILPRQELQKALEYISIWETAVLQRDLALRNLESPGLGVATVF